MSACVPKTALRGTEEGRWCWGHGESSVDFQGRAMSGLLGHCSSHSGVPWATLGSWAPPGSCPLQRALWGEGPSREDGAEAATWPCVRGKQFSGNLAGPETASTLSLWGWGVGRWGMNCGPENPSARACHVPHSVWGSHPVLFSGLAQDGGGLVFSPGDTKGLWAPSALLCWQTQDN